MNDDLKEGLESIKEECKQLEDRLVQIEMKAIKLEGERDALLEICREMISKLSNVKS